MNNYLNDIKELYPKAQEKIKEIIKFYENNKDTLLSGNNFKVHDVSWYMHSNMQNEYPLTYQTNLENNYGDNGIFSWFCDSEFDCFKDENNLDLLQYVGRTSTFYFVPEGIQTKNGCYAYCDYKNKSVFVPMIFDYIIDSECITHILEITDNYNIIFKYNLNYYELEELTTDIEHELQAIIDFDINEFYKECLQVYANLMEFKNNQVEIFKGYCDQEEELQKEEKEKEENEQKQEKQKLSILKDIINFYLDKNGDNIMEGNNKLILDILGDIENKLLK